MRTALLLLLLAACSGGGASPRPFTPSADIAATHPFLVGLWLGEWIESGQPATTPATTGSLNITSPGGDGYTLSAGMLSEVTFQRGSGFIRADGDRFQVVLVTDIPAGTMVVEGTVSGGAEMVATWTAYRSDVSSPPGSPPDASGTLRLTKQGAAPQLRLTETHYDSPDLLLVVRREWR